MGCASRQAVAVLVVLVCWLGSCQVAGQNQAVRLVASGATVMDSATTVPIYPAADGDITVEFWARASTTWRRSTSAGGTVFSYGDDGAGGNIQLAPGGGRTAKRNRWPEYMLGSDRRFLDPSDEFLDVGFLRGVDGHWHHYAMVFELSGSSGELVFYVDGREVFSSKPTPPVRPFAALPLTIGARRGVGDANRFEGEIDEVRVWSTQRTRQQLNDFMHRRLVGNENGLLHLWNFDEGAFPVLDRVSGTANLNPVGGTPASDIDFVPATWPDEDNVPVIETVYPLRGQSGSKVTVTGRNFIGTGRNSTVCRFGNYTIRARVTSELEATCKVPNRTESNPGPDNVQFSLSNNRGITFSAETLDWQFSFFDGLPLWFGILTVLIVFAFLSVQLYYITRAALTANVASGQVETIKPAELEKILAGQDVNTEALTGRRTDLREASAARAAARSTAQQPKRSTNQQPKRSTNQQPKRSTNQQPKRSTTQQTKRGTNQQPKRGTNQQPERGQDDGNGNDDGRTGGSLIQPPRKRTADQIKVRNTGERSSGGRRRAGSAGQKRSGGRRSNGKRSGGKRRDRDAGSGGNRRGRERDAGSVGHRRIRERDRERSRSRSRTRDASVSAGSRASRSAGSRASRTARTSVGSRS